MSRKFRVYVNNMNIPFLGITDDRSIIHSCRVGFDIDTERTVDFQFKSTNYGIRHYFLDTSNSIMRIEYLHCRIINFPFCLHYIVSFYPL